MPLSKAQYQILQCKYREATTDVGIDALKKHLTELLDLKKNESEWLGELWVALQVLISASENRTAKAAVIRFRISKNINKPTYYTDIANPNEQDKDGYSALHYPNKEISEIQNLLAHPLIDVNLRDKKGYAPIHYYIQNTTALKELLRHPDLNVNINNEKAAKDGSAIQLVVPVTALNLSIDKNEYDAFILLLEHPFINVCEQEVSNLIDFNYGLIDIYRIHIYPWYLELFSYLETRKYLDYYKESKANKEDLAFLYACRTRNNFIAKILLEQGANINVQTPDGESALILSWPDYEEPNFKFVDLLLAQNNPIYVFDNNSLKSTAIKNVFKRISDFTFGEPGYVKTVDILFSLLKIGLQQNRQALFDILNDLISRLKEYNWEIYLFKEKPMYFCENEISIYYNQDQEELYFVKLWENELIDQPLKLEEESANKVTEKINALAKEKVLLTPKHNELLDPIYKKLEDLDILLENTCLYAFQLQERLKEFKSEHNGIEYKKKPRPKPKKNTAVKPFVPNSVPLPSEEQKTLNKKLTEEEKRLRKEAKTARKQQRRKERELSNHTTVEIVSVEQTPFKTNQNKKTDKKIAKINEYISNLSTIDLNSLEFHLFQLQKLILNKNEAVVEVVQIYESTLAQKTRELLLDGITNQVSQEDIERRIAKILSIKRGEISATMTGVIDECRDQWYDKLGSLYFDASAPSVECLASFYEKELTPPCLASAKPENPAALIMQFLANFIKRYEKSRFYVYGSFNRKESLSDLDIVIADFAESYEQFQQNIQQECYFRCHVLSVYKTKKSDNPPTIIKMYFIINKQKLGVNFSILPLGMTIRQHAAKLDLTFGAVYYEIRTGKSYCPIFGTVQHLQNQIVHEAQVNAVRMMRNDPGVIFRVICALRGAQALSEGLKKALQTILDDDIEQSTNIFALVNPDKLYHEMKGLFTPGKAQDTLKYIRNYNLWGFVNKLFSGISRLETETDKQLTYYLIDKIAYLYDSAKLSRTNDLLLESIPYGYRQEETTEPGLKKLIVEPYYPSLMLFAAYWQAIKKLIECFHAKSGHSPSIQSIEEQTTPARIRLDREARTYGVLFKHSQKDIIQNNINILTRLEKGFTPG
ncbi:MAG TPA: ankyrin repeat domain-containing protein [Legionellaceae bacterium]|nr:ankyrin repeat domain-containing protein [Legionellaceae bacterium]